MGYCMTQAESEFFISAENLDAAFVAACALNQKDEHKSGGSYSGGKQTAKWFSWVSADYDKTCQTLVDVLGHWGWDASTDDDLNITELWFAGDKIGDERHLFEAIAPFVKDGSYVSMMGEDGCQWRWYFDGFHCQEQNGRVIYG